MDEINVAAVNAISFINEHFESDIGKLAEAKQLHEDIVSKKQEIEKQVCSNVL